MWIIVCASYLITFSSNQAAQEDFSSHAEIVQGLACKPPVEANEAYLSELMAGKYKDAQYFNLARAAVAQHSADEAIADAGTTEAKDTPSTSESATESTAASTQDEKHCRYNFVRTGPRTLRLVTGKCWKKVS